jgi:hypothetical protein
MLLKSGESHLCNWHVKELTQCDWRPPRQQTLQSLVQKYSTRTQRTSKVISEPKHERAKSSGYGAMVKSLGNLEHLKYVFYKSLNILSNRGELYILS